jgi:hypothetical protein
MKQIRVVDKIRQCIQKKDWCQARKLIDEEITKKDHDVDFYGIAATVYRVLGEKKTALTYANLAIQKFPTHNAGYIQKLITLVELKEWLEAREVSVWLLGDTSRQYPRVVYFYSAIVAKELQLHKEALDILLSHTDGNYDIGFLSLLFDLSLAQENVPRLEEVILVLLTESVFDIKISILVKKLFSLFFHNNTTFYFVLDCLKKIYLNFEHKDSVHSSVKYGLALEPMPFSFISMCFDSLSIEELKYYFSGNELHEMNVNTLKEYFKVSLNDVSDTMKQFRRIYGYVNDTISVSKKRRNPRIAICISGQLRGFNVAYKSWEKIGLSSETCDIYIHSWCSIGRKKPTKTHSERVLPRDFSRIYKDLCIGYSDEDLEQLLPNLFSLFMDIDFISEAALTEFYNAKVTVLDDDSKLPFSQMTNSEKMYYKIQNSFELLGDNHYDLVVRIRPDFKIEDYFDVDWSEILSICEQNDVVFCDGTLGVSPTMGIVIGDQFAVATPKLMSIYSQTYSSVYDSSGNKISEKNLRPHVSLFQQLSRHNCEVNAFKWVKKRSLQDPEPIKINEILTALKKDSLNGSLLASRILDKYIII